MHALERPARAGPLTVKDEQRRGRSQKWQKLCEDFWYRGKGHSLCNSFGGPGFLGCAVDGADTDQGTPGPGGRRLFEREPERHVYDDDGVF